MGPDKFQLCKELHDLENNIFSYKTTSKIINFIKDEIYTTDSNGKKVIRPMILDKKTI